MANTMDRDHKSDRAAAILRKVQREHKGKLTIFLGAAPGVGKTYAMLSAAREVAQQGCQVLVGLVETHGRVETENMLSDLPLLPRKSIHYRDTHLTEFNLDEALKQRPQLILVDELAHSNVPGSRHKRRYQDINELLDAGIDVFTTVNIQHLASVNDMVLQITGVRVRETVPDSFFDVADDIRFIDLPPNTLIERLQQGKVYLPDYARAALDAFFSTANLIALRELAMKKAIERVDENLNGELQTQAISSDIVIQDKLLVLISSNLDHQYLIRIGRQMAQRRQIKWSVVWVDTGRIQSLRQRKHIDDAMALARDLGASTETLRGSSTFSCIVPYIHDKKFNTVLVGSHKKELWSRFTSPLYQQLIASSLPIEVSVHKLPVNVTPEKKQVAPAERMGNPKGHWMGLLAIAIATPVAIILQLLLSSGNLVLIYVLAIMVTGLKYGARPAIMTAIAAFLSFNFFLTEPRYTFQVDSQGDIATLLFLVIIGVITGPAASRIRHQFMLLQASNRTTETLRDLAQDFSVADDVQSIWLKLSAKMSQEIALDAHVVEKNTTDAHHFVPKTAKAMSAVNLAAIDWTFQHQQPSGKGTETLSAATITSFPIVLQSATIGVLILDWSHHNRGPILLSEQQLIEAMLQQSSNTYRRIKLVSDLESARVKTEVEQLRSALLSSVSHDLKSPLAAMMGAAESVKLLDKQLSDEDRTELLDTILNESQRLDRYIQNLLDMTRLGHGTLKIERDWVSPQDIISSALQRLKRYFHNTNTRAVYPPESPLLYVHAALVEQAIFNILENAVRFNPQDGIITVELIMTDDTCMFVIEDDGPGIPAPQREQIFDMFYVVADGDRKKQNTGMGLAICKGMIKAHGGDVSVKDAQRGKGCRFEVRLPLRT